MSDRYVRSVHTAYDSDTYKDSCVELFVQPAGRIGYFALEVNAGGAFSLRYIEDPTRTSNRFAKWVDGVGRAGGVDPRSATRCHPSWSPSGPNR